MPKRPHRRSPRLPLFVLGLLLLALAACEWSELIDGEDDDDDNGEDNTPPVTETNVAGLNVAQSGRGFDATLDALGTAIDARSNLTVLRTFNHRAAASGATLRPTTVVFVDDPNQSSALIAADARAALDLPARVLVYRDSAGDTGVAYSNAVYLDARYDLDSVEDDTLDAFDADLEAIATEAAAADLDVEASATGIRAGEGIVSVASPDDFNTTLNRLRSEIQGRDDSVLAFTIDFQLRAAGRAIDPTTLVVFSSPVTATPLLRSSQTIGIDLPQKMLVSADEGGDVTIHYNAPRFLADRHDIDDREDDIEAAADLLCELAGVAAGGPDPGCNDSRASMATSNGEPEAAASADTAQAAP